MPLIDAIVAPLGAGAFGLLFGIERLWPLRARSCPQARRLLRNFLVSAPAFVLLRLAMVPAAFGAAAWAAARDVGILHWLPAPRWLAIVAGFILMDWIYYAWHRATHRIGFLWRFHAVHHSDLDLDVTTAARFHFGEIVLSVPFRAAASVALGISVEALAAFEICFQVAVLFHHSNWKLPLGFERALGLVLVTPRLHGIHHSIVRSETDSNWGTIFSFWDRLHRTLRRDVPQASLTIGVPAYRDVAELSVLRLWAMPFGRQRPWRLPSGEVPGRAPSTARRLVA